MWQIITGMGGRADTNMVAEALRHFPLAYTQVVYRAAYQSGKSSLPGLGEDLRVIVYRVPPACSVRPNMPNLLRAATPVDRFFVRCHTYTPKLDLDDWSLKVDGKIDRPMAMSMNDLRTLPRVQLVAVTGCAGNGRSFYEPRVEGTQWAYGSVGNTRWTGVRLRDVLQKAGIQASAREVLFDGADKPLGRMADLNVRFLQLKR